MWFRKLFDSLKSGGSRTPIQQARRGPPRRQPAACRLAIEALEDRCVPASLTVSDVSILEGNAGTRNALVTVTLTGSSNPTVSVVYSTANGTAVAGNDYQAVSGTLTFTKGVTSKSILVPVIGDTLVESNEAFFVNLKNAKHATIADGQGAVTIVNDDAQISIGDVTLKEGNSGTTNFVFTVSLSAASGQPVTVNYATANGTAAVGSDYDAKTGTLTIPAGQTSGTITVLVNGDQLGESDETFFVNLSSPTNATIADGQGVGTIVDDEPRINIAGWSSAEGNAGTTEFSFTVTLSAASDAPVTVNYATADGTATTADNDYAAASGTLTFLKDETSKTITVLVNGDQVSEPEETFLVNLSSPTNGVIVYGQGVGTIGDDEPRISIDNVSSAEGNAGTTEFTFTVTLSAASDVSITVDFATADDTAATADNDYVAASGSLTFAPGELSKTVTVLVNGDLVVEYDEYFVVNLSNATNAQLSNSQVWGTILTDDNPLVSISDSSGSVWQPYPGETTYISFTVTLSAPSSETVTVDYYTIDGSATANYDYVPSSGTLSFAPGETNQTFSVEVLGGYSSGYDKTFYVSLSGTSSNALIQPGWGTGAGTIWDNEYYGF